MSIHTTPDTILTWARRHPRAIMFLGMLAAFAAALVIAAAARGNTTPVYWSENGTGTDATLVTNGACHRTDLTDGIQSWACDNASFPAALPQCVETVDHVVLCSGRNSTSYLARVKVTR